MFLAEGLSPIGCDRRRQESTWRSVSCPDQVYLIFDLIGPSPNARADSWSTWNRFAPYVVGSHSGKVNGSMCAR